MAGTNLRLVDGQKLEIFSSGNTKSSSIQMNNDTLDIVSGGDVIIGGVGQASNLVFEEGASIHGQGTNTISLGIAGDTINLNVTGVTYNFGTITGSPTVTGNLIVKGAITPSVGSGTTQGIEFPPDPGGGSGDRAWLKYYVKSGEDTRLELGIANDANDTIDFVQQGSIRMTIYGGNIGIGTTVPSSKLEISGGSLRLPSTGYEGAGQIQCAGTVRFANGSAAQEVYVKQISVTDSWADADANKVTNGIYTKGGIKTAGQIISTVSTGTAPFSVSSTTVVTNLNSDLLDGYHANTGTTANTIPVRDTSGNLPGNITGNAATASKFQTARTIQLTGDVTGSVSFDGSSDVTISAILANSGVSAGTYTKVTVDAKGRVTAGSNPTTLAGYGIIDAVQNAGNTPSIQAGLEADRPTAGTAGRLYIATDTKTIYRDDGAAWQTIASASGTASRLESSSVNIINTTGAGNIVDFQVSDVTKASVDNTGKFTGTIDWNNVSNKPSTYPPSSHMHNNIIYTDTRSTDFAPFTYTGISIHLKYNTTDGLSDGGTYHGVLHLTQWGDATGGRVHQLGFTDNGNIYFRQHTGSVWTSWNKIWHAGNDGAGSGLDADLLDGTQLDDIICQVWMGVGL